MSKINCSLIKDLLPLYIDELCSNESTEIIKNHLEVCEECNKEYSQLKKEPILKEVKETLETDDTYISGFEDADISLRYSKPKLKVKINKDGIIESGEWSYTVCIDIENLRIDVKNSPIGATVKKGYGEVDFICTVG